MKRYSLEFNAEAAQQTGYVYLIFLMAIHLLFLVGITPPYV
jgi:hypothetical protein